MFLLEVFLHVTAWISALAWVVRYDRVVFPVTVGEVWGRVALGRYYQFVARLYATLAVAHGCFVASTFGRTFFVGASVLF